MSRKNNRIYVMIYHVKFHNQKCPKNVRKMSKKGFNRSTVAIHLVELQSNLYSQPFIFVGSSAAIHFSCESIQPLVFLSNVEFSSFFQKSIAVFDFLDIFFVQKRENLKILWFFLKN
jgi:hypothetical protein